MAYSKSEYEYVFRAISGGLSGNPGNQGAEVLELVNRVVNTPRRDVFAAPALVENEEEELEYVSEQLDTTGSILESMQNASAEPEPESPEDRGIPGFRKHQWMSRKRLRSLMRRLYKEGRWPVTVDD